MDVNAYTSSQIDTILIKVASRCNINCSYCYVYHMGDDNWSKQSKLISNETIDSLICSLGVLASRQQAKFSIVLHGGEPLLLGSRRLAHLLERLRTVLPASYPISIQTNGVLITTELLDICSAFQTSVAVSIDGPEKTHDKLRLDHKGMGTFHSVMKGISLLKAHKDNKFLNAGLLAVIDPSSDAREVYSFFKEIDAPSVDFLYKDGNHDRLPSGKLSATSIEYGEWMSNLLDVYLDDADPVPIRVIDDMLKVLLGGMVSKEGMGLTDFGILIIDTDGTIMKNDTLKSTFNGADKFSQQLNIRDTSILDFIVTGEFQEYKKMQRPVNEACINCANLSLCGGGMMLHRWGKENGFDNPSIYCSDQFYLIDHMRQVIKKKLAYATL
ncbi:cyclophane-forming radical SAM/SPASM peptide maturase YhhB [Pedobacter aquatilis]|uniref:cyclophane-forming radical SAM/SPASM peptide maturase YhhB n=1 Tax=Pedobacter aquatilis TaxID=351343 RepID=UPI0025B3E175|nr:cyclophane-forming radical SAM/SPASM peptide maturase YhhB [Pedobacter aquatilis]MDN3585675.1 cyclophane-forming radical SAM/SPASM peptide maturase YhhB [Pedobacter aquatilis]